MPCQGIPVDAAFEKLAYITYVIFSPSSPRTKKPLIKETVFGNCAVRQTTIPGIFCP